MSIRFRVWLYFLGFTAIILVLIWFLQIFFLNHYYEEMKIRRTEEAANQLVQLTRQTIRTGSPRSPIRSPRITTSLSVWM